MRWIVLLALSCTFVGCTWNTEIEPINHTILLHDNSSKVWLVDQMLIGDRDYTPLQMEYKEVVVFHENSAAYFYRLKEFGQKKGNACRIG